jgi:hypothetical protein
MTDEQTARANLAASRTRDMQKLRDDVTRAPGAAMATLKPGNATDIRAFIPLTHGDEGRRMAALDQRDAVMQERRANVVTQAQDRAKMRQQHKMDAAKNQALMRMFGGNPEMMMRFMENEQKAKLHADEIAARKEIAAGDIAGREKIAAGDIAGREKVAEINKEGAEKIAEINITGEKEIAADERASREKIAADNNAASIKVQELANSLGQKKIEAEENAAQHDYELQRDHLAEVRRQSKTADERKAADDELRTLEMKRQNDINEREVKLREEEFAYTSSPEGVAAGYALGGGLPEDARSVRDLFQAGRGAEPSIQSTKPLDEEGYANARAKILQWIHNNPDATREQTEQAAAEVGLQPDDLRDIGSSWSDTSWQSKLATSLLGGPAAPFFHFTGVPQLLDRDVMPEFLLSPTQRRDIRPTNRLRDLFMRSGQ